MAPPSRQAVLPVDRSRDAISDAVFENRVTIVLGGTGCGKSSRVPQYLLEDVGGPVLCTQPRRLAVVTIAKRVAKERGVELGGDEVGYRIGQRPHCTSVTRIVFATAGVLLEDLKGQGAAALLRFKAIVLDEVHERSVESDLVLACIREFMQQHKKLKLVLMSATCDVAAYSNYFRPVSEGRVARIQLNDLGLSLRNLLRTTEVKYLEDVVKFLGKEDEEPPTPRSTLALPPTSRPASRGSLTESDNGGAGGSGFFRGEQPGGGAATAAGPGGMNHMALLQYSQLLERYKNSPSQVEGKVGDVEQRLLRDLVVRLHRIDAEPSHAVLVFLPTYKTLEMQHELLLATGLPLAVFALHSSIDLDECIGCMEAASQGRRKVILATNIAESSVTIPGVRYVVDACRTLQLAWHRGTCRMESRIIFASRSQCDQRKGRTGRTCDGIVYRLLPRKLYLEELQQWESPLVTLLHLRRETLGLLCAASPLMSNAASLLGRCMAPPSPDVAVDALAYLATAGAAEPVAPTGRSGHTSASCGYQPTAYGRFLGSLPVSIESAQLVAQGGKAGLLHASAVLAAILNTTPFPIHQPFASLEQYRQNLRRYGGTEADPADPHAVLLANLAAFFFWHNAWRIPRQVQHLRHLAAEMGSGGVDTQSASSINRSARSGASGDESSGGGASLLPDIVMEEQEWCLRHSLIRSSLHSVAELADAILCVTHIHRPDFLASNYEQHAPDTPHISSSSVKNSSSFGGGYVPATGGSTFGGSAASNIAGGSGYGAAASLEAHLCRLAPAALRWGSDAGSEGGQQCVAPYACLSDFYSPQACRTLKQLVLSKEIEPARLAAAHSSASAIGQQGSLSGRRQPQLCRFFMTPRGCTKGALCAFSHDLLSALDSDVLSLLRTPIEFESWAGSDAKAAPPSRAQKKQLAQQSQLQQQEAAQGDVADPFSFSSTDTVLLLGEGDLSFTDALMAKTDATLVSSVLLTRQQLLQAHPGCNKRLARLEAAAEAAKGSSSLSLLFGLCATQLHRLGGPGCRVTAPPNSASPSAQGWRVSAATHVVWQFPHTGVEEDDEGHRQLMKRFFASLGAALLGPYRQPQLSTAAAPSLGHSVPKAGVSVAAAGSPVTVILSLGNDQFSRWHVEAAARASFFYLAGSTPFSAGVFPGYEPRRGYNDDTFPLSRALTYIFSFHPPVAALS